MKRVILAACAAMVLAAPTGFAEELKFAVVPKAMNNPFFDIARDGCMKRAKELGDVECVYRGPIEHEPATQVQIIQDLITQGLDGIAISVSDVGAATGAIKAAKDAGLVVITFDADAPGSARQVYVGTDNKEMGRELGRQLLKLKATPGTFATQSGGPAADNLNERLAGLREVAVKAGWKEASGSPTYCNDDSALANQQLADLTTANPTLDALVPVGGWALFAPEAYKGFVNANKQRYDSGKLTLVMPDTLPVELKLLKEGYAQVLVGQRPFEMGEKVIDILIALKEGKKVDPIIYTGLDVVTKDNVDKFLKM
jgi:ribose transport system substrate-binding protein